MCPRLPPSSIGPMCPRASSSPVARTPALVVRATPPCRPPLVVPLPPCQAPWIGRLPGSRRLGPGPPCAADPRRGRPWRLEAAAFPSRRRRAGPCPRRGGRRGRRSVPRLRAVRARSWQPAPSDSEPTPTLLVLRRRPDGRNRKVRRSESPLLLILRRTGSPIPKWGRSCSLACSCRCWWCW